MKFRNWFLLLMCVSLLAVCCQSKKKKNTPEAVTEAFVKAFYTADFTHMYQYTTKKSQIVIKTLQNDTKGQTEKLEEMKSHEVAFVSTSVNTQTDSTANCTCKITINGEPRQDNWDLLKEKGEWKVTLVLP